ncbi:hypothetical protein B0H19DRAFT_1080671 [Mycena capillaripes]|nr:hypothetical protein B0H19DRAFT_1080671 [Mycena capillaripes]
MQVTPGGSRNFKNMAIIDGEREWSNDGFRTLSPGAVSTDPVDGLIGESSSRRRRLRRAVLWVWWDCRDDGTRANAHTLRDPRQRWRRLHHVMPLCPRTLTQESREIELEE